MQIDHGLKCRKKTVPIVIFTKAAAAVPANRVVHHCIHGAEFCIMRSALTCHYRDWVQRGILGRSHGGQYGYLHLRKMRHVR